MNRLKDDMKAKTMVYMGGLDAAAAAWGCVGCRVRSRVERRATAAHVTSSCDATSAL